jgi:hypothetical protein
MSKAKRKHISNQPHRHSGKAVDPSIALGLRYFSAYRAFALGDSERDEMEGEVRAKYPQAPAESCFPNSPNPNVGGADLTARAGAALTQKDSALRPY